jgi:AraC-like DNA-binding protein
MLRAVTLEADGAIDVWGVRVQPWGARVLFDGPALHLTGRLEPARDVNRSLVDELERAIDERRPASQRVDAMWAALARRVSTLSGPDALAVQVSRHFLDRPGHDSVARLARDAGLSSRQLERRFLAAVGISPSTFARIARFQRVFAALDGDATTLANVAIDCGYYDQSHLARDVKAFTGGTPAALCRLESTLTEHFLRARRMSGSSKTGKPEVA